MAISAKSRKRSGVGKRIDIPTGLQKSAKKAFELRNLGFKGATTTGWNRAKQLRRGGTLSINDLKTMRAWYARHTYSSMPTYVRWKRAGKPRDSQWFNKRGIIAWLTWGGDAGKSFVESERIRRLLDQN